jgi:hypothetical protein
MHILYNINILNIEEHMNYFFYIVESLTHRQNDVIYIDTSFEES